MKYRHIKVLAMIVLCILTINYISSQVLAVVVSEGQPIKDKNGIEYVVTYEIDDATGKRIENSTKSYFYKDGKMTDIEYKEGYFINDKGEVQAYKIDTEVEEGLKNGTAVQKDTSNIPTGENPNGGSVVTKDEGQINDNGITKTGSYKVGDKIEGTDGKIYVVQDGPFKDANGVEYVKVIPEDGGKAVQYKISNGKLDTSEEYKGVTKQEKEKKEELAKIVDPSEGIGDPDAIAREKAMMRKGQEKIWGSDIVDGIVGVIMKFFRLLAGNLGYAVQSLATVTARSADDSNSNDSEMPVITPDYILFNRIALTDINFFDGDNFGGKPLSASNPVKQIRKSIADWYYVLRTIAVILLLLALVYVGIRLAISTVAEDQAKYKQWLMNWIVSMCLLFVLHYLIVGVISVNNSFVNVMYEVQKSSLGKEYNDDKEKKLGLYVLGLAHKGINTEGNELAAWSYIIIYVGICAFTFIFLIMYIKRMITVAFLIMISPIITITYSIDKLGDNKSQALNTWIRMFMETVLIQPFHCIIYLAFIATAVNCVTKLGTLASGLFALMCLAFIFKAEAMVKEIFQLNTKRLNDGAGSSWVLLAGMAGMARRLVPSGGNGKQQSNVNNGNNTSNVTNTGNTSNSSSSNSSSVGLAKANQTSNIGRQNLNNISPTTNVPIINGKTGQTASVVTRNNTIGTSGTIIAPTANNYQSATQAFNAQLNNGTLGAGGTINPNAPGAGANNIILPGQQNAGNTQILGANGQPIGNTNQSTPITAGTSRSAQLANGATSQQQNPTGNSNVQPKTITGAKSSHGMVYKGGKAVLQGAYNLAKLGLQVGTGATVGLVGATMAAASGKDLGDVIKTGLGAGVAGAVAVNKVAGTVESGVGATADKVKDAVGYVKKRKGEKDLADAYHNYRKEGSYDGSHMSAKTNELMGKTDDEIDQMPEGTEKAYARALHAMPVIYEENGTQDAQRELIDTIQKIQNGQIKPRNNN